MGDVRVSGDEPRDESVRTLVECGYDPDEVVTWVMHG